MEIHNARLAGAYGTDRAKLDSAIAFGHTCTSLKTGAQLFFSENGDWRLNLPRPRSTVVYRDLPEGAILFCTRTEVYYSLNPIGARIWQLLPPVCTSEEEIVARLSDAYPNINLGKISADVRRLIDEFVGNGLVETSRAA